MTRTSSVEKGQQNGKKRGGWGERNHKMGSEAHSGQTGGAMGGFEGSKKRGHG